MIIKRYLISYAVDFWFSVLFLLLFAFKLDISFFFPQCPILSPSKRHRRYPTIQPFLFIYFIQFFFNNLIKHILFSSWWHISLKFFIKCTHLLPQFLYQPPITFTLLNDILDLETFDHIFLHTVFTFRLTQLFCYLIILTGPK